MRQRVVDLLRDRLALGVRRRPGFLEGLVARLLDELGDAVHGPVERLGLVPLGGARSAIPDLGDAVGIDGQLIGGRPLGAERALVDRAFGIAFDVDDLAVRGR